MVFGLQKFTAAYIQQGWDIPNRADFSARFHIAIVNEHTAAAFFQQISPFEASTDELRSTVEQRTYSHISDMFPSLYVDVDGKQLFSSFPEPASYERYVPDGWRGTYGQWMEIS